MVVRASIWSVLFALLLGFGLLLGYQKPSTAQNSWNEKVLLGGNFYDAWQKRKVLCGDDLDSEVYALKSGQPVGFEPLTLQSSLSWGADFILDHEAARYRKVMRLYPVAELKAKHWDTIVKTLAKLDEPPQVAFVSALRDEGGSDPSLEFGYFGVPVKWNKNFAGALRSNIAVAPAGDPNEVSGIHKCAAHVLVTGAESALSIKGQSDGKASFLSRYNSVIARPDNPNPEQLFFATSAEIVDIGIEPKKVITSGAAWPASD